MEPNQEIPPINQPTTPAIPSVVISEERSKKSHKPLFLLIGILMVLILIGGIGGGYYFQNNKNVSVQTIKVEPSKIITMISPTSIKVMSTMESSNQVSTASADWKLYVDDSNVYSFTYPSSLNLITEKLDGSNGNKATAVFVTDFKTLEEATLDSNRTKKVHPLISAIFDKSLNEPEVSGLTFQGENKLYPNSKKYKTSNGYLVVSKSGDYSNSGVIQNDIYVKNPNGGILIFSISNIKNDILDKIISSIKFMK